MSLLGPSFRIQNFCQLILLALCALFGPDKAAEAQSSFVSLGVLPGGNLSIANGVSTDGLVAVGDGNSANAAGGVEAFRWVYTGLGPSGGTLTGLGFLPGGTNSQAFGTNADASVVVGSGSSTNAGANYEAYRWVFTGVGPSGGTMTGLGFLPGGNYSLATAVNADGSVVVGYGNSTSTGTLSLRPLNGQSCGLRLLLLDGSG